MEYLIFEKRGSTGILQINRPNALNALSARVLQELLELLQQLFSKNEVRLLVLTGAGEKAFIAGADIKEMQAMNKEQALAHGQLGHSVAQLLATGPCITVAAVNGYALGGGLEMALACDFIYTAKKAKLGLPEVSLGLIPGFGGTQRLTQAIGARAAKELIFSGRQLTAQEALQLGLVNRVCEDQELLPACLELGAAIQRNSFAAVLKAKRAIDDGIGLPLQDGCSIEGRLFAACFSEADGKEGMKAFVEKRAPVFQ